MRPSRTFSWGVIALSLVLSAVAPFSHAADGPHRVVFETTCDKAVQTAFHAAVTQLHSFEYPEAERQFRRVAVSDPACAMAQWGIAMSLWHPLWAPPTSEERAEARLALTRAAALPASPRERQYMAALKQYYADSDATEQERRIAYRAGMAELHASFPGDAEAGVFYALSLLATASPQDKTYALQRQAAALLESLRESQPRHPGVLHYIIHSYDYPGLAERALTAAETYAASAPDSAHAQHMPSHIFTRLGMWDASLSSNKDSTASAAAYTRRAGLPGHYDEGLHSIDYLMYALLQTARDDEALQLLRHLRTIDRTHPDNFKVAFTYAAAPARYALERYDWHLASNLELGFEQFRWGDFPWALSIHHFARGLGAARSEQAAAAHLELAAIRELQRQLVPSTQTYLREEVQVHIDMLAAWLAQLDGDAERALQLAGAAADREDAVDKHPVTPGEVLPARELYAELLLINNRPVAALAAYQQVLASSPNRFNAHLGAARAALAADQRELAADHYRALRSQASAGNEDRAGLAEARRFDGG